jgi:hypothetical protein
VVAVAKIKLVGMAVHQVAVDTVTKLPELEQLRQCKAITALLVQPVVLLFQQAVAVAQAQLVVEI